MSKTRGFVLAVSMVLAMAFTFSCSSDDEGGEGGGDPSSSSVGGGGGNSITYEDETYPTVVIGTQTWLAKNLNYAVEGSKCYGEDGELSPAEVQANCDKYGRLYDWSTAMDLPSSCNSNSCSNQIQSPHQGICPSGWHLPSDDDWVRLMDYAGGSAGTKLKATSGWSNCGPSGSGSSYSCSNTYGFSALPGGSRNSYDNFGSVGTSGNWWSAHEDNSNNAYYRNMTFSYSDMFRYYGGKSNLFSVRCVQDGGSDPSSSSTGNVGGVSSSSGGGQGGVVNGTPVTYEGETYPTVVIGTQTWLAKNLNYAAEGSKCHDNDPANCTTYGRLYDWSTAMGFTSSCNTSVCSSQIQSPHRGICPSGWHLPSDDDWDKLFRYVDGTSDPESPYASPTAGKYLKAKSGWRLSTGIVEIENLDTYGFSALPGDYGYPSGDFGSVGSSGYWWSADERDSSGAYYLSMSYGYDSVNSGRRTKSYLYSVRCVQD
jgi:uncharacterized protein (TIGR02145 family)